MLKINFNMGTIPGKITSDLNDFNIIEDIDIDIDSGRESGYIDMDNSDDKIWFKIYEILRELYRYGRTFHVLNNDSEKSVYKFYIYIIGSFQSHNFICDIDIKKTELLNETNTPVILAQKINQQIESKL